MPFDEQSIGTPDIEDAIDRYPLTVSPEMPLAEAIALMSQTRGNFCSRVATDGVFESMPLQHARSSCVLVVQGTEILGIVTERDIVRLTAIGIDPNETAIDRVMAHPVVTLAQSELRDIFAPLFLFRRYRMRHLAIIDEAGRLVGVVSSESIRRVLRPANLLKVRRVSEVMSVPVIRASTEASVFCVARLMAHYQVSCVVITDPNIECSLPVGIITERDIVQFQALRLDLADTPAAEVMSSPLFLLAPDDSLWTAHREMQRRRVRRLVVSWDWGRQLGIVTQTSLLRIFDPVEMYGVVQTLQRTIEQLEGGKTRATTSELPSSYPQRSADDRPIRTLTTLQTQLESLRDRPHLSVEQRQAILDRALKGIDRLHQWLEIQTDCPNYGGEVRG